MPVLDRIRPATLTELSREDSLELYVINNGSQTRGMQAGIIIFNVQVAPSEQRIVRVPNTWVPVNIGLQAPKKLILESVDFLQALNRRAIIGVLNRDATKIFADDNDARLEADRISQDLTGNGRLDDTLPLAAGDMEDAIDPDLNMTVVESCGRDDIDEGQLYAIVRRLQEQGSLKPKDYNYILVNTKHDRVLALANDQLSRLQA